MKKLGIILLVLAIVLAMTGCAPKQEAPKATDAPKVEEKVEAPAGEAKPEEKVEAPAEEAKPEDKKGGLSLLAVAQAEEEKKVGGEIIYGSSTEISGDWAHSAIWTNNATDNMIRKMINDYGTVANDKTGALLMNPTVAQSIESKMNDDGTKTFTVKLHEDLKFNDGTPITAKNYVLNAVLFVHPTLLGNGSKSLNHLTYVGGDAYSKQDPAGEPVPFAGVRMLGDYEYSLTVVKDKIPYFYDLAFAALSPMSLDMWLGEGYDVKDDGNGVYITGDMTPDTLLPKIEAARFKSEGRISAGPYQLVSYDKGAKQAVLEINPNYKGNFEGVKPHVQKVIVVKAETATQFDALATGGIDLISSLTGGDEINKALDLVNKGGFDTVTWERAGYGKLMFQADFGPTQFKAVRHAVAHLLNRPEFANTFTGGFGGLVHGPYGIGLWQYQEGQDALEERLNSYPYSFEEATKLLEADGWTLNEKGEAWTEGLRYKEVTADEAGEYEHNIKVGDKTLMPLRIEWASSENNPVSELLVTMLAENPDVRKAGMEIKQNVMTFAELLNWMYRDASQGAQYAVPKFGMYNLASNFNPEYDYAYNWTLDPEKIAQGYNVNFLFNEELDKLSMDMVYGVEAGDNEAYMAKWVDYIDLWNELLPEIPLYSNQYYTVFADKLQGYEQGPFWSFDASIVYCWVK